MYLCELPWGYIGHLTKTNILSILGECNMLSEEGEITYYHSIGNSYEPTAIY